jgi:hypothetical protein
MHRVGFEPMIPVCERTKTVHTLDRAATVIGQLIVYLSLTRSTGLIKCSTLRMLLDTCVVVACGYYNRLIISARTSFIPRLLKSGP